MTRHHYDNAVHPDNVYGHTLDLLRGQVGSDEGDGAGVHLDVACGFGNIAEHVRDDLGLHYVGLDVDADELAALGGRGFETHLVDLMSPTLLDRLEEVVDGRRIVSVSFLDGLEHLVDGSGALRALSALIARHDAVLVTSVPNVTHRDVAVKALLGRWDYTLSGLLDRTHVQLWSASGLEHAFTEAGLEVVARHDVELEHSDQHFPADHVALSSATSVGSWLSSLRADVSPHRFTNQFVWASRSGSAPLPEGRGPGTDEVATPLLSVLLRTGGPSADSLDEALLSIAAQTDTDVEVIVLAEAVGDALDDLRTRIAEQPPSLRQRLVLVPATGSTAEVLNTGLAAARGLYVALGDGVTWLAHWVESVRRCSTAFPGRCVRGMVLDQVVDTVTVGGAGGLRATDAPVRSGARYFSLADHLRRPLAPTHGLAFPRSLATDLALTFDDALGTAAVRRHLLRAVELAGVVEVEEIVGVRQLHGASGHEESDQDLARLVEAIDSQPWLAPAGAGTLATTEDPRLGEARTTIGTQEELIRLKDDHIRNIESALVDRDARIARLEERLDKRTAQIARLREKVRAAKGASDDDLGVDDGPGPSAPTDTDGEPPGRGRWFRR